MSWMFAPGVIALLFILALAAYIDRIYFEMGKFQSREYAENIDAWEELVEPKLRLTRESAATSGCRHAATFSAVRCTLLTNWSRQMTFATDTASGGASGTVVEIDEILA